MQKRRKKKELQAKLYVHIPGGRDYTFLLILNVFCDPNMIRRYLGECFWIHRKVLGEKKEQVTFDLMTVCIRLFFSPDRKGSSD